LNEVVNKKDTLAEVSFNFLALLVFNGSRRVIFYAYQRT